MRYLSHRDLGDEHRIIGTDWVAVRDAAGRIAAIYPCSSDDYDHDHIYPHGDGGGEREGASGGQSEPHE